MSCICYEDMVAYLDLIVALSEYNPKCYVADLDCSHYLPYACNQTIGFTRACCKGDFSLTDFQLAILEIDDDCDKRLSHNPKTKKLKNRWALDDFWLHMACMHFSI